MFPRSIVLTVRARRALARPAVRRLAVAVLAVATALTVSATLGAADAARDRWGPSQPVAVATRDLATGDVVDATAIERRDLPGGLVTEASLAAAPVGAVVRHPILAGEPLVAERLAPHGLSGVAALVPPGHRAVAVPVGPTGVPPLSTGDLVDVVTVLPTGLEAGQEDPAFPLVEGALVVDVAEQAVTIAVPAADAPRVAWVLSNGTIVLVLAGG